MSKEPTNRGEPTIAELMTRIDALERGMDEMLQFVASRFELIANQIAALGMVDVVQGHIDQNQLLLLVGNQLSVDKWLQTLAPKEKSAPSTPISHTWTPNTYTEQEEKNDDESNSNRH